MNDDDEFARSLRERLTGQPPRKEDADDRREQGIQDAYAAWRSEWKGEITLAEYIAVLRATWDTAFAEEVQRTILTGYQMDELD